MKIRGNRKYLMLLFAAAMVLSSLGCKRLFIKKTTGEVTGKTYPVAVDKYDVSVRVKATPQELIDYFISDLSWVEKVSDSIQVEISEQDIGKDMTQVGQGVDFKIKLLGMSLPCRMTCLKYIPEKELWLLLTSGRSWVLWRITVEDMGERELTLESSIVGQPSSNLDALLNAFNVIRSGSERIDLLFAIAQAEFDPSIDPVEVTSMGLRGELYRTLFNYYESSVSLESSPSEVVDRLLSDPANFISLVPMVEVEKDCLDALSGEMDFSEDVVFCPASYRSGEMDIKALMLSNGLKEGNQGKQSYYFNNWIIVKDLVMRNEITVERSGGNALLKVSMVTELPEQDNPELINLLVSFTRIPDIMSDALEKMQDMFVSVIVNRFYYL